MPQLQNVVLKDRASTPVDHTFTPRNIENGVGETVESQGVPVGENRFTIGLRRTTSGRYRGEARLVLPQVQSQVVNGVTTPVVVRTAYATVVFDFAATSTEAERNNAVGMVQSSLAATVPLVNDTFVKLQGVY